MIAVTETENCVCVCEPTQTEKTETMQQQTKRSWYDYDQILQMGAGLNGRRDKITMNHSLATGFFEEEYDESADGVKFIFKRLTKAQGNQICATERDVFLGSFGITLKHPQIVASFEDDLQSFRVDDGNKTFRTFRIQSEQYRPQGCKNLRTYKKAIKRNKQSRGGRQYTESFVVFDMERVSALWITENYARSKPRPVLEVWEHAVDLKKPCYVVNPKTNKWVSIDAFVQNVVSKGINSPVGSYEFLWYLYAAVYCRIKCGQKLMDALYSVKRDIIPDGFDYSLFISFFFYDVNYGELDKWENSDPNGLEQHS